MGYRALQLGLIGALLSFGCQGDKGLTPCHSGMQVAFQSPAGGESFAQGFPIPAIAIVNDLCGRSVDEAEFVFSSNVDERLSGDWEMVSDDEFHYTGQDILSLGDHTLTLKVIGSAGNEGETSIDINIIENLPPTIEMLEPTAEGLVVLLEEDAQVTIAVSDPEEPPESLALSWQINGEELPEGPLNATESGDASFTFQRSEEGCYAITATVTDAMGNTATASGDLIFSNDEVFLNGFTYRLDEDEDGWGSEDTNFISCSPPEDAVAWTEIGDCNDEDDTVFPGAADYCDDGIDSDCNISTPLDCSPLGSVGISSAGAVITGLNNSFLGVGLKNVGDFNSDNYNDLLVGAYINSSVYLVPGPMSGFKNMSSSNSYDCRIHTDKINTQFGRYIRGQNNDFNGDGIVDSLISATEWHEENLNAKGAAYILFGQDVGGADLCNGDWNIDDHLISDGHNTGLLAARLEGNTLNSKTGSGLNFIPDVDGDGLDDIIIGAWSKDEFAVDSGSVYLIQSSDYGLMAQTTIIDDIAHLTLSGGTTEAKLGIQNIGADVDGDGIGDLIMSRRKSSLGNNYGMTQIVFGRDIPIAQSLQLIESMANITYHGMAEGDGAVSLSVAGDLDADGDDEFFIGAGGANNNNGLIYLVPGFYETTASYSLEDAFNSAVSPNAQASIIYEGTDGESISHISNAGDINNDSHDDWLIGGRLNSTTAFESGAAYLLYGGPNAWGSYWNNNGQPINQNISISEAAITSNNAAVIYGDTGNHKFGSSTDGGDLSGDGISDLIIGSNTPNSTVYIFFGGGT